MILILELFRINSLNQTLMKKVTKTLDKSIVNNDNNILTR